METVVVFLNLDAVLLFFQHCDDHSAADFKNITAQMSKNLKSDWYHSADTEDMEDMQKEIITVS